MVTMTPEQVQEVRELEMTDRVRARFAEEADRVRARFAEDLKDVQRKSMRLTLGIFAIVLIATLAVLFAIISCAHADSLAVPMYPDMPPEYDFNSPLECSYYPSSPCYVKPRGESAVERSQREYEQRQRELQRANNKYKRCLEHPERCK
jgi:hypothetical protein